MADVHSPSVRSHNMRAIRSKNTRPEIRLTELLEQRGFATESHVKELPGTPDIVLRDHSVAIFVNGCFWHGHDCYLFKLPAERREFWQAKIQANRERDARKQAAIEAEGMRVLIVWECALKGRLRLQEAVLMEQITQWVFENHELAPAAIREIRCLRDVQDA